MLLWEEYLKEHPGGYSYSQFCHKYMNWKKGAQISMRQVHKAGEKVFVDYSGMKVAIYDKKDPSKVLFEAENGVQNVQRRILAKLRSEKFFSISELNIAIRKLLEELNSRTMKQYGKSRRELFLEVDRPALRPLPKHAYVFASWKCAKVNVDYHIEVDRHYYSVPFEYVRKAVDIKVCEKTVEVYLAGQRIAIHNRSSKPYQHTTIKEHMPAKHRYLQQWTPMRFLEWADKFGPETKIQINSILLSRKHPEQSYRSCLGILSLGKKHGAFRLEKACEVANGFGAVSVKTVKNIINNNQGVSNAKPEEHPVIHSNIRGDTEFH